MSDLLADRKMPTPCRRTPAPVAAVKTFATRNADLGDGLMVRRALPHRDQRMVGPWCFLDHFGPVDVADGGLRVAPHPHIGLQTVTWLVEGEVLHRDSLGNHQAIFPGQLNLMTAGAGIAHSEESPVQARGRLHGVQLWTALPETKRRREPAFAHHPELPRVRHGNIDITLVVGDAFDRHSPALCFWPAVALDLAMAGDVEQALPLQPDFEHALLVLDGSVDVAGHKIRPGRLIHLAPGRNGVHVASAAHARAFLIGGAPFNETVLMWWNFVARTPEEIRAARNAWDKHEHFREVPGYEGERLASPPLTLRRTRLSAR